VTEGAIIAIGFGASLAAGLMAGFAVMMYLDVVLG